MLDLDTIGIIVPKRYTCRRDFVMLVPRTNETQVERAAVVGRPKRDGGARAASELLDQGSEVGGVGIEYGCGILL